MLSLNQNNIDAYLAPYPKIKIMYNILKNRKNKMNPAKSFKEEIKKLAAEHLNQYGIRES